SNNKRQKNGRTAAGSAGALDRLHLDLLVAREVGEGLLAHDRADEDAAVAEAALVHARVRLDVREQLAVGQVRFQRDIDLLPANMLIHGLLELSKSDAGFGADRKRRRMQRPPEGRGVLAFVGVGLVEKENLRLSLGADLLQHLMHRIEL